MSDTTIEWTDKSWNPIRGCSRVSEGCRHCYAETVANRFQKPGMPYEGLIAKGGQWNGKIKLVEEKLIEPWNWVKPRRIFVNSMSDLFHENVPFEYIASVFAVMAVTTRHTYQVLTKRPERMLRFFRWLELKAKRDECNIFGPSEFVEDHLPDWPWRPATETRGGYDNCGPGWPYENVWLGVSVEDQKTANERIPLLLGTPAAVRWISAEPLLERISLPYVEFHCDLCGGTGILARWPRGKCHVCGGKGHLPAISTDPAFGGPKTPMRSIDWVVVGGESGPNARPMHPDWARLLRDQCTAAGVPFLLKQMGGHPKKRGNLEDIPEDLRVREYPL